MRSAIYIRTGRPLIGPDMSTYRVRRKGSVVVAGLVVPADKLQQLRAARLAYVRGTDWNECVDQVLEAFGCVSRTTAESLLEQVSLK